MRRLSICFFFDAPSNLDVLALSSRLEELSSNRCASSSSTFSTVTVCIGDRQISANLLSKHFHSNTLSQVGVLQGLHPVVDRSLSER